MKFTKLIQEKPKLALLIQFIKFGIVGVSNTLISMAVYYITLYIGLHYQLCNFIGFVISVTNAYYWNSKYVFNQGTRLSLSGHIRAYIKVFTSYGITYLLSVGLLFIWVEKLGISKSIAPVINLLITIPLNFVLNKLWAFKKENKKCGK